MRKENTTIKTKFISEAGSYLKNNDYFAFVELEDCACYCIADGIDQDPERESAKLAVAAAIGAFQEKPKFSKNCAKYCMQAAHRELKRETKNFRLEASILIIITNYQKYRIAQAGNVRLYQFRNGRQIRQSQDQSLSQELAEAGHLPKDKIEEHEERHNLYCYLGQPDTFQPNISKKLKMEDGDIFILCTRGIWQHIGTAEYLDAIEEAKEPDEVINTVEETILSRKLEQLDNYTIACIFIDKTYKNSGKNKKIVKKILLTMIPILIIALTISITYYTLYRSNQKKITQMLQAKQNGIEFFNAESYNRASQEFMSALSTAKKIKYKENSSVAKEKKELEDYDKLTQILIDAIDAMEKGKYEQAVKKYRQAEIQAKAILILEEEIKENIKKQKELAMTYFDIQVLINNGDNEYSIGAYDKAIEAYTEAVKKASGIYDAEDKKTASDKLAEVKADIVYQEQKKVEEEADSYADSANGKKEKGDIEGAIEDYKTAQELYEQAEKEEKSEEMKSEIEEIQKEKEEEEKENYIIQAERKMTQADECFEQGNYTEAEKYYQEAIEAYAQAGSKEKITTTESKLLQVQSKNTSIARQKAQAEEYIAKAEEKEAIEDFETAIVLYGLAQEIYQECDLTSEVEQIKKKKEELSVKKQEIEAANEEQETTVQQESIPETPTETEEKGNKISD